MIPEWVRDYIELIESAFGKVHSAAVHCVTEKDILAVYLMRAYERGRSDEKNLQEAEMLPIILAECTSDKVDLITTRLNTLVTKEEIQDRVLLSVDQRLSQIESLLKTLCQELGLLVNQGDSNG